MTHTPEVTGCPCRGGGSETPSLVQQKDVFPHTSLCHGPVLRVVLQISDLDVWTPEAVLQRFLGVEGHRERRTVHTSVAGVDYGLCRGSQPP